MLSIFFSPSNYIIMTHIEAVHWLEIICGGKASEWLQPEMTKSEALEVRNMILEDYKSNSMTFVGIEALKNVLRYLAEFRD